MTQDAQVDDAPHIDALFAVIVKADRNRLATMLALLANETQIEDLRDVLVALTQVVRFIDGMTAAVQMGGFEADVNADEPDTP